MNHDLSLPGPNGSYIKVSVLIVLLIMALHLNGCQSPAPAQNRKYHWDVTCSAPVDFPAVVIAGALYAPGNVFASFPSSALTEGEWGMSNSFNAKDVHPVALPDTLRVLWFAVRERKFYGGEISLAGLPIREAFAEGYFDKPTGKRVCYNGFRIGLAPGGRITVWVYGGCRVKELGMLQAKPVNYDAQRMTGPSVDVEQFVELLKSPNAPELDYSRVRDTISEATKWWNKYRRRYSYRLRIASTAQVSRLLQKYFNGEALELDAVKAWDQQESRVVPKELVLS